MDKVNEVSDTRHELCW